MSEINGGGVFPDLAQDQYGTYVLTGGMTLRDYFAAKAMQALIEKTELVMQVSRSDGSKKGASDELLNKHRAGICSSAYRYADAMLKEREK